MRVTAVQHWAPAHFTRVARTHTTKPLLTSIHGVRHALFWDAKRDVPAVINDTCPHRGASLSNGGRVTEGCIKCAYHGKRVGPSHADRQALAESGGLIWLKSGCGQLPEHEKDPPSSKEFEGNHRVVEYTRSFSGCSPILCVENTLDWSHLESVHAFHLIEGVPKVTIKSGGAHGRAMYVYTFLKDRTLTIENEYWGPWSTCLRFIFDGQWAFTLHFSFRPESKDNTTLFVRVVRPASSWPGGSLADFVYTMVNELPLMEDRYIVRHADPTSWSKNRLTDDDAFLKEYRSYMMATHPDVIDSYVS